MLLVLDQLLEQPYVDVPSHPRRGRRDRGAQPVTRLSQAAPDSLASGEVSPVISPGAGLGTALAAVVQTEAAAALPPLCGLGVEPAGWLGARWAEEPWSPAVSKLRPLNADGQAGGRAQADADPLAIPALLVLQGMPEIGDGDVCGLLNETPFAAPAETTIHLQPPKSTAYRAFASCRGLRCARSDH
jgi:hypothetical protein